jgi:hypothetical protein
LTRECRLAGAEFLSIMEDEPMKLEKLSRRSQLLRIVAVLSIALLALALAAVSLAAGPEGAAVRPAAAPAGTAILGNYVWDDSNSNNGTFDVLPADSGEEEFAGGIDGVLVCLYLDANGDNKPQAGELVTPNGCTTTGENPDLPGASKGWYSFDVGSNGTYMVQVEPCNFVAGGGGAPGCTGVLEKYAQTNTTSGPDLWVKDVSLGTGVLVIDTLDFGYSNTTTAVGLRSLRATGQDADVVWAVALGGIVALGLGAWAVLRRRVAR